MDELIKKIFAPSTGIAITILRLPIGLILAAHGSQKLFGWFGGYGLEGTGQFMVSIGLSPGYLMALLAGSAEFFGGVCLMLGLLTRPAGFICALTMLVALFWVHWGNGFFLDSRGIEYALALSSATLSLAVTGGGCYSLDNYLINKFLLKNTKTG